MLQCSGEASQALTRRDASRGIEASFTLGAMLDGAMHGEQTLEMRLHEAPWVAKEQRAIEPPTGQDAGAGPPIRGLSGPRHCPRTCRLGRGSISDWDIAGCRPPEAAATAIEVVRGEAPERVPQLGPRLAARRVGADQTLREGPGDARGPKRRDLARGQRGKRLPESQEDAHVALAAPPAPGNLRDGESLAVQRDVIGGAIDNVGAPPIPALTVCRRRASA